MNFNEISTDMEVVRSKGDYVVGRKGKVVQVDDIKKRARVAWYGNTKTWVSHTAIEPSSIPYEIKLPDSTKAPYDRKKGARYPIYIRK